MLALACQALHTLWLSRKYLAKALADPVLSLLQVNDAFRQYAAGPMKGILAVSDEPLVSVDFRCTDVSTSIDSSLTMVMGDDMVKVVAWYDNEVRCPFLCAHRS